MLPEHLNRMVGLQTRPLKSFRGNRLRAEGMPQSILRPGDNSGLFCCVFKGELKFLPRHYGAALPHVREQPFLQIGRNFNEFPSPVLGFLKRKIDEISFQFHLAPIKPDDFLSAES